MKAFKTLSWIFAGIGVLLMICAVLGRFISEPTVFGDIVPPEGMDATSVMIGANSFLLLAILAHLFKKE
ncbi:hypothetical protein JW906_10030 [bacterium]|nr:hypothetical protein [bacterium]